MQFYSLNDAKHKATFKEAVIRGIAPDKGLYFPNTIEALPTSFFENIQNYSNTEIAFQAIHQFVSDEIPDEKLKEILENVLDFDFPVISIENNVAALELFHGPTMAFKDVGARFMANCLGYFSKGKSEEVTVLVATSGDTGGAVANGFLGIAGVKVVILYPAAKVSEIQEKQLTTLGQNITALEVDGTFDDCQRMVKTAFLDSEITTHRQLTSANSINVARWLPQLFYFLFAYRDLKAKASNIVFSIPSGNFGNICAGMVAQKLGMPCHQFIAATNVNDTVPRFMENGVYEPKPSVATISNAMDVGDPSNFIRIRKIYNDDFAALSTNLRSYRFSDEETKAAMTKLFLEANYLADPHGAVAYLGLQEYFKEDPNAYGVFLETAHPVKFLPVVEEVLGTTPAIPPQIQAVLHGEKKTIKIKNYQGLKDFLLTN